MNAPAKLNLFLHVQKERGDGYHPLQSLVAFAGCGDVVAVEAQPGIDLKITGPFAGGLNADVRENIILRAARALHHHAAVRGSTPGGAAITLTKNLPLASGIGGGSADAAATLRELSRLWGVDIDAVSLARMALKLGADVPVCLYGHSAWMEGIGEKIAPGPALPPVPLVLVNPGRSVSTAEIFATFDAKGVSTPSVAPGDKPDAFPDKSALMRFLKCTRNDLEKIALTLVPEIGHVLAAFNESGALFARMSGSGATCFGFYETAKHAEKAVNLLRATHSDWWIQQTSLLQG